MTTETSKNWKEEIISAGSERSILSIILNKPDAIVECEEQGLSAEHFVVSGHRFIFMSIKYLYETSQVPEPLAIMEVMTHNAAKDSVKELGGLEYINALFKNPTIERNIDIYIKKLKQTFTRRKLMEMAENVQTNMTSEDSKILNPAELVGTVQRDLDDIATSANETEEVYKMGSELDAKLQALAENPMEIPGIESGYYTFDKFTGGMLPGDLLFVCARSKTGKSVLLTNIAYKLSVLDRLPVLYIDTEMPSDQVETRLLAIDSGLPEKEQIKSGMFTIDDDYGTAVDKIAKLKRSQERINNGLLYHIYMPNFTIEKVSALIRKYKMKHGIVAVFFDYLKMPQSNSSALKYSQEYQQLGFMASALKDMAGVLNIPIYSAVQANRSERGASAEDMDESNIGGSDRILQLASKLVFLANKSEEDCALHPELGNQQLRVKFQRNGECDLPPINMRFYKGILRMEEV
jgi:replicative DNA helicase